MQTQDFFYISLSICAIVLTLLVLINLYYMFRVARDLRGITKDTRKKVASLLTVVDTIREKLNQSVETAQNVTETAKGVVQFVNELRGASSSRKRNRSKK